MLAPVRLVLLAQGFATGLVIHIVVRDSPVLALVVGYGLIFVIVGFGVEGDDVPGVKEAGDVAEGAEEDVDEAVGGADAGFDPDGDGGEEDGEEAEEDVAAAHCVSGSIKFRCESGLDGVVDGSVGQKRRSADGIVSA